MTDRTPKPCHHKIARHEHGTRTCYVLDRCRCEPCATAATAAENQRRRLKAYGRYQPYIDAEPARQHLRQLVAAGMGANRIAEVSGVAHGVISSLLYGKWLAPGQTRWQKRIKPDVAAAILATTVNPANPVLASPEQTLRARHQIRALVALGWSMSSLGQRLGMQAANACRMITDDARPMKWATVRKINRLYEELSMTLPPATGQREKISVTRSKRLARERGWVPPLELEALTIDQGDQHGPDVDEQAIWRRLHGDKTVRLSKVEKIEAVRQWQASGQTLNELVRMTGWEVWRYVQKDLEATS